MIEACRLRLRPILMTSFAFILGVLPLVVSSGSGSEMRQAVGVAVFFGMLGVTLFGLIFTPIFYMVVRNLAIHRRKVPPPSTADLSTSSPCCCAVLPARNRWAGAGLLNIMRGTGTLGEDTCHEIGIVVWRPLRSAACCSRARLRRRASRSEF